MTAHPPKQWQINKRVKWGGWDEERARSEPVRSDWRKRKMKSYPSLVDAIEIEKPAVKRSAIERRLSKGMSEEEALTTPRQWGTRRVIVDGREYPSYAEAARATGHSPTTIRTWAKKGKHGVVLLSTDW